MRTYEIWATEDDMFAMDYVVVAAGAKAEDVANRKAAKEFGAINIFYLRSEQGVSSADAAFRFADWQDREIAKRFALSKRH